MNKKLPIMQLFLILFIFIRSINFSLHLNFSYDQAWFSTRVLEIWRNKEFTLVGPGSSIIVNGKQVLYGSINYYFQLIFQILGKFDPVYSSYFFMLFAAFMIIPLYFGVEKLANKKTALLVVAIYALAPTYIDFTRFFFAPNFQLSLLPIIFLLMGMYKQSSKKLFLFLIFFVVGVLMQFHFAVLLQFILLLAYYLRNRANRNFKILFLAISGFIAGLLPLIIFELKNDFYNIRVFIDYLQIAGNIANFEPLPHRYLVLSFTLLVLIAVYFKQFITAKIVIAVSVLLFIIDLLIYAPIPKNAFGMSSNWNYPLEKKAYELIKKENLQDFNIVNLIYDNLSVVIKYHLKKDNPNISLDDYYHNKYLFVINKNENIFTNPAYEVNTFKPNKKLKQWKLNDFYNLYLYERLKQ